ncbi:hypothetical protein FRB94_013777 [Tulasnella sp. JGI-2019a]|nr:hypothetical protein FRB93_012660 [Tulasnella sp. JGI-2019a]KAG8990029.1 hypothetical protein FRB94_013777 [Tulasnella sp. JGI-2019a]KAG9021455.1 hypothetical protein FRB95_002089 [Tulasnella sp. JGI-2019a]
MPPEYVPTTFFGQLLHALAVTIQPSPELSDVDKTKGFTLMLLDVEPCNTVWGQYGFYEYRSSSACQVIDATAVRAVVGRIWDGGKWVIVKRSGSHEHARYQNIHDNGYGSDEEDEDEDES